jgi:hypothetical protein
MVELGEKIHRDLAAMVETIGQGLRDAALDNTSADQPALRTVANEAVKLADAAGILAELSTAVLSARDRLAEIQLLALLKEREADE